MNREEFIELVEQRSPQTVFAALGIQVINYDPDALQVAIDVDERHHQHFGLLHGGVSVVLAESAASLAAAMSVDLRTQIIAGVDINATHLRPKRNGRLVATAKPVYRGKTTHVYEVRICDEQDQIVCLSRCTIAVRNRAADLA